MTDRFAYVLYYPGIGDGDDDILGIYTTIPLANEAKARYLELHPHNTLFVTSYELDEDKWPLG